MRTAYKVLAFIIAAEVAVQAIAMVYAVSGLVLWVADGGVVDSSALESQEALFPEMIGIVTHAVNGMYVIPALAVALLIVSFFTKMPGAAKWAGLVLLLVGLQATLGLLGHETSVAGALHGLNALLLFSTAMYTGLRARSAGRAPVPAEPRTAAPA